MATPLKQLEQFIFKGSSVTGRKEGTMYNVYSYSTLMASFSGNTLMWFDDTSYSNTTAKLQHYIRANYTIDTLKLNAPKSHKVWTK